MLLWLFGFYHKTEHKVQFLKKMPSNCSKRKDSRSKTVYIYIYIFTSMFCHFVCKFKVFFKCIQMQNCTGRENILFSFNFKAKILD